MEKSTTNDQEAQTEWLRVVRSIDAQVPTPKQIADDLLEKLKQAVPELEIYGLLCLGTKLVELWATITPNDETTMLAVRRIGTAMIYMHYKAEAWRQLIKDNNNNDIQSVSTTASESKELSGDSTPK